MDKERSKEPRLPKELLEEKAKVLFDSILDALQNTEEFKDALVKRFMNAPQGNISSRPGYIKFEHNGIQYDCDLTRNTGRDDISLRSYADDLEEKVSATFYFDDEVHDLGLVFGGEKRGKIRKSYLSYMKFDWRNPEDNEDLLYTNSPEAIEKAEEFLQKFTSQSVPASGK